MFNLYSFGETYGFQNFMDPVLESELKKCKTQEERDKVMDTYRTSMFLSFVAAMVIGALVCGVISLFT